MSKVLWSDEFTSNDWQKDWDFKQKGKLENTKVVKDSSGKFERVLRVHYPKGSATQGLSRSEGSPYGGAFFYANLGIPPKNSLHLSYYLRFCEDFDFVKGGKLPGLFGGEGGSGGKVPNGVDGFTTRFMWRRQGDGEVYAYLANSPANSFGKGNWRFKPGKWCHLEQEVILNQPGKANGRIRAWADGKEVVDEKGLTFRTVDTLKIDGIYFSTFFGGSDLTWATPKNVHVDFAKFSVLDVN